ncbi:Interleukin-1 family member 10 [Plecturocebus cupreus]
MNGLGGPCSWWLSSSEPQHVCPWLHPASFSNCPSLLPISKDQTPLIAGMCSLPMARYYTMLLLAGSGPSALSYCFRIKYADQKVLYTRDSQLLVGDPVADNCCAEKICILPNKGLDRTKVPIFLGIQGGSRCLACVETGEEPSLQLENLQKAVPSVKTGPIRSFFGQAQEASRANTSTGTLILQSSTFSPQDVNIEELYKGGEETTRFTFFQSGSGSAFRLEAAAWPGWFLCGPVESQQPVQLTKESEPSTRTEFYFEQSR